jgi:hypothetical protein
MLPGICPSSDAEPILAQGARLVLDTDVVKEPASGLTHRVHVENRTVSNLSGPGWSPR